MRPMSCDSGSHEQEESPASGSSTRNYTLYPWVTSGCTCSQNDFDLDTNNGTTGSAGYTSRGGTFTHHAWHCFQHILIFYYGHPTA